MSIGITWSDDYRTGIDIIDQQHRRLFDYFAEIEQAIATGEPQHVTEVCRALSDYVHSHFAFEEALMEKAGYPLLDAHRQVHARFTERTRNYLQRIEQGVEPLKIAREMRSDIGLWLINHIKQEDRHYVANVSRNLDKGVVSRLLGRWFR